MKIGDIVGLKGVRSPGVVTDFEERKCWRTGKNGPTVDWSKIDPEPHAIVLFASGIMRIPVVDLEIVSAPRCR